MIANSFLYRFIPVVMLLSLCGGLDAQTVSGHFRDEPMTAVIRDFEQQTSLSFVYEKSELDAAGPVTADFDSTDFRIALDRIFTGRDIRYEVNGRLVMIYSTEPSLETGTVPERIRVSGVILDRSTGEPVIGASVMEAGGSDGTVADIQGRFSLQVGAGDFLVVSCIGYEDYEFAATPQSSDVLIRLGPSAEFLEDVVVVGYGTTRKVNLTGAVDQVSSERCIRTCRFMVPAWR